LKIAHPPQLMHNSPAGALAMARRRR